MEAIPNLILRLARASCRLLFAARSCRPFCCLEQTRRPTLSLKKSVQIHASS